MRDREKGKIDDNYRLLDLFSFGLRNFTFENKRHLRKGHKRKPDLCIKANQTQLINSDKKFVQTIPSLSSILRKKSTWFAILRTQKIDIDWKKNKINQQSILRNISWHQPPKREQKKSNNQIRVLFDF